MADPAVIVEKDGQVLIVTLNRPEKKNAVNSEVMCRLYDAWVRLDDEDEAMVATESMDIAARATIKSCKVKRFPNTPNTPTL